MTKLFGNVCVLIVVLLGVFSSCNADLIDNLFSNDRYVRTEIACVLGRGNCDKMGEDLKKMLVEVVTNQCRSCTPARVQLANRVKNIMNQRYPNEWNEIVNHYQPNPALRRYN